MNYYVEFAINSLFEDGVRTRSGEFLSYLIYVEYGVYTNTGFKLFMQNSRYLSYHSILARKYISTASTSYLI